MFNKLFIEVSPVAFVMRDDELKMEEGLRIEASFPNLVHCATVSIDDGVICEEIESFDIMFLPCV